METPLAMLRKYDHTPKEILFNRFHYPHEGDAAWYATTAAPSAEMVKNWTIRVDGLVQRPRTLTIADLQKMPQEKRVSVLQCAGNGRSFYAAKQKVAGGQWKNGGMGNVEWEGVPLMPLLDRSQDGAEPGGAMADGRGMGPAGDTGRLRLRQELPSLRPGPEQRHPRPEDERRADPGDQWRSGPADHPRLLRQHERQAADGTAVCREQSPSAFQSVGYRMPLVPVEPGQFEANDYTIHNSVPTYGHKIKSVIFSPLPEDGAKAGAVEITGVAFNDGEAKITMVEVSADGGKTWVNADIKPPESPWAWHHWSAKATLASGANTLMCRATDALGRSQPMDGLTRWNPRGYEWNGVDRVDITV